MTPPLQPALRTYRPSDHDALMSLWSSCGLLPPWNDPRRDIERKPVHDPDGLLVLEADGCLAGSVMVGYDGHRGWVNYLAVDPAWQGRGLGRMLMDKAEQRLLPLGCPKVNLQVRTSNEHAVAFYRHLGYGTDDVVSMGKRLLDDVAPGQPPNSAGPRRAGPEAHRTPETGRFTSSVTLCHNWSKQRATLSPNLCDCQVCESPRSSSADSPVLVRSGFPSDWCA